MSERFRFRGRRALGLALVALLLDGSFVGCSGRTSAPGGDASTQTGNGGSASQTGGSSLGGVASGGKAPGVAGKPASGAGKGGRPSSGGQGASSGDPTEVGGEGGNSAEVSAGSGGSAGALGSGGHGGGPYICIDSVCGYQCTEENYTADPGTDFYPDCNKCHCSLNGFADCEKKDCDLDCAYIAGEYEGAFGEAQYCWLEDIDHPDPCLRTQPSTLTCQCPAAVSKNPEFVAITEKWAHKWQLAGCTKPDDVVCPPCKAGSGAHCDDNGVCAYGN